MWRALAVAMWFACGCVETATVHCENGITCPVGSTCVASGCALAEQIAACVDQPDGADCTFLGARGTCQATVCVGLGCGDGQITAGEVCDDGNVKSGDGCRSDCRKVETCGDLVIDEGEDCDDGNTTAGDRCSALCQREICGNGVVDSGEECDDGNSLGGDTCGPTCLVERCGNGFLDLGEGCDDGNSVGGDTCQPNCLLPHCGDGIMDPDEICDDGDNDSGDGCNALCSSKEICGNGIVDLNEACDLATSNSLDPDATCRPDCSLRRCGDGVLDPGSGEDCEGTDLDGRSCTSFGFYSPAGLSCNVACGFDTSSCTGSCGDSVINGPETCDASPPGESCSDLGYDMGIVGCSGFCQPDVTSCRRFGWASIASPIAGAINDMSGVAGDVWAAGTHCCYGGDLLHYNGTGWSRVGGLEGNAEFYAVHRVTTTDIVVVGYGGGSGQNAWRWNGTSFTAMPGGTNARLYDVWGPSSTDLWAVGSAGTVRHFVGGTWTTASQPATTLDLEGIWGTSSSNLYVVGVEGLFHFDGSAWSKVTGIPDESFKAVWGTGANDVFAVGYGVIVHYNGTSWQTMVPGTNAPIYDVSGNASNDVYAVGHDGRILHYDGNAALRWTPMESPTTSHLYTVSAVGDLLAGGIGGKLLRYKGTSFEPMSSTATNLLNAVWGTSAVDVFAVGDNGAIQHYDGTAWTAMTSATEHLNGVAGFGPLDVYAAGDNGHITHYNGTWTPVNHGLTTVPLTAVTTAGTQVYAVGLNKTILRYNGSWSVVPYPFSEAADFTSVWASSANDVWITGTYCCYGGVVAHWNGTAWTQLRTFQQLDDVWGTGPTNVYVSGEAIYHFDGSTWTKVHTPLHRMYALWGGGAADVFAAGDGTEALHWDGRSWKQLDVLPSATRGLWGTMSAMYFVGQGAAIDRLARASCLAAELRCDDYWDDDCDGVADGCDADCAGQVAERCANDFDDDCDGLADCNDADCSTSISCP